MIFMWFGCQQSPQPLPPTQKTAIITSGGKAPFDQLAHTTTQDLSNELTNQQLLQQLIIAQQPVGDTLFGGYYFEPDSTAAVRERNAVLNELTTNHPWIFTPDFNWHLPKGYPLWNNDFASGLPDSVQDLLLKNEFALRNLAQESWVRVPLLDTSDVQNHAWFANYYRTALAQQTLLIGDGASLLAAQNPQQMAQVVREVNSSLDAGLGGLSLTVDADFSWAHWHSVWDSVVAPRTHFGGLLVMHLTDVRDAQRALMSGADLLATTQPALLLAHLDTLDLPRDQLTAKLQKNWSAQRWLNEEKWEKEQEKAKKVPVVLSAVGGKKETTPKEQKPALTTQETITNYQALPIWADLQARALTGRTVLISKTPERPITADQQKLLVLPSYTDSLSWAWTAALEQHSEVIRTRGLERHYFGDRASAVITMDPLSPGWKKVVQQQECPVLTVFLRENIGKLAFPETDHVLIIDSALLSLPTVFAQVLHNLNQVGYYGNSYECIEKNTAASKMLQVSTAQNVGIAPEKLVGIDAIIKTAIRRGEFPAAQVFIAKEGKIIYDKAFGTTSYRSPEIVTTSHLFDLASMTKILATTPAVIKLTGAKRLFLRDQIGRVLGLREGTPAYGVTVEQLLTHKSGFRPSFPIERYTLPAVRDFRKWKYVFYRSKPDSAFSVQIGPQKYASKYLQDTIWNYLDRATLKKRYAFRYSDVNFYLLAKTIELETGAPLNQYVQQEFYQQLGVQRLTFLPLEKFAPAQIVPTENDRWWRRTHLRGYVHDPTTAVLGGVGGSAGLFGNAHDVGVVLQMLLQNGAYGDQQLLPAELVQQFTKKSRFNHRGLGFDKPAKRTTQPVAKSAPASSFGHSGFTGTCGWVDPDEELVFVFLSNRLNPRRDNWRIARNKTRERVHEIVYDALNSSERPFLPDLSVDLL